MSDFVQRQDTLQQIQNLASFKAVIEILQVNLLEHKDKKIYKEMTVFEAARSVYEGLVKVGTID